MKRLLLVLLVVRSVFGACDQDPSRSRFHAKVQCSYAKPCLEDQPNKISLLVDTGCYHPWVPCQPFTFGSCDVVEWDFGDGTQTTITGSGTISHVWNDPGRYLVEAHIRNAKGSKWIGTYVTIARRPPAFVSWSDAIYTASEGADSITLKVKRGGDTSRAVTVLLNIIGASPSGGAWFGNVENVWDRPITIPAGASSLSVPVLLRDDDVYRGEQRYDVFVYDDTGEAVLPAGDLTTANAQIRLIDDETGPTLTVQNATVEEGDSGSRTVRIPHVLSQPLAEDLLVWWEAGPGSATVLEDWKTTFDGTHFRTETIRAGERSANLELTVIGDRQAEADETIVVRLGRVSGAAVAFSQPEVVITIVDDDAYKLTPAKRSVSVGEKVTCTLATTEPSAAATTFEVKSSAPSIVAVPPSVTLAAGANETSFDVETLSPGTASVRVKLPDGRTLSNEIVSARTTALHFTTERVRVKAGGETWIALQTDPPVSTVVTIERAPAILLDAPPNITTDAEGQARIAVRGILTGTATLSATLPDEYGSTKSQITVDVVQELSPHIGSITPVLGSALGGTRVSISGSDFSPDCAVSFGDVLATSTFSDDHTLIATTPAHFVGTVDVIVQCGAKTTTLPNAYRFTASKRRAAR